MAQHPLSTVTLAGALGATILSLAACDETPEAETPEAHTVTAVYELPGQIPFPSDVFTQEDATTATGLRVNLTDTNTDMIDYAFTAEILEKDDLIAIINTLDGFSTIPQILVGLSGEVDDASLPGSVEETILDDSSVFLFDLETCEAQAFRLRQEAFAPKADLTLQVLVMAPDRPLSPGHAHGVAVTKRVEASDGTRLGASADFEAVVGVGEGAPGSADELTRAQGGIDTLLECLAGVDPALTADELAVVTTFTTQTATAPVLAAREFLHGPDAPALAVNVDPNDDGVPDTVLPQDLPRLPDNVGDLSHVGLILRGTFAAPDFRDDDGDIQLDADGEVSVGGSLEIPFLVTFPLDTTPQPFPVVILHHGYSARKEFVTYVADYFAQQGMAMAAIDAVGHGELSGTGEFMNFFEPALVRGSFSQTEINVLRFVQALDELGDLDVAPGPSGDGVPDLDLSQPIGYVGESLGGIVGATAGAVEPRLGAAVLNVTGGELGTLLLSFLGGLFPEEDALALVQFQGLMQAYLDRADPLTFSRHVVREPRPGASPKQILMQPVVADHLISVAATEALAVGIGMPYLCPCQEEVALERLERGALPAEELGLFYFTGARHGFFLAEDDALDVSDAAREQAAEFLATYYATGTAQIVEP